MRKGGDGDSLAGTSYKWGRARGHVCGMWILFFSDILDDLFLILNLFFSILVV